MTKTKINNLSVAIVGAGPAALYTAAELAKYGDPPISVSLIDRLPTIGGLARYGVAPDHTERRQIIGVYEKHARSSGNMNFFGNVEIGDSISVENLHEYHHAVIYATGASSSRKLDIPGTHLPGYYGSSEFVGWYNGHPDHTELDIPLESSSAVIIGNGNVALDIARLLLADNTVYEQSDMALHARKALAHSSINEVFIIGRRGPAQAKFTHPELLELGDLADVYINIDDAELDSPGWDFADFSATVKKSTLHKYSTRNDILKPKKLSVRFLSSPVTILGKNQVEGIKLSRNKLVLNQENNWVAELDPEAEMETLAAGLIIDATGYQGRSVPGAPFDMKKGVIPNQGGRVLQLGDGAVMPGHYAVGWIKRGPRGVLGTNKICARETVRAVIDDFQSERLAEPRKSTSEFGAFVNDRQPLVVNFGGWKAIDRHEQSVDREMQPGRKLTTMSEMIQIARSGF